MKKKYTIWILIGLGLVFIAMLLIKADTINARFSLAFTAIASLSTVATLLIAMRLYDKFGLKQHLIMKRAEKIFELLDTLLEYTFVASSTDAGSLMIRANLEQLKSFKLFENFELVKDRTFFFSFPVYQVFFGRIQDIRTSYWLPVEIQERMDFFILAGMTDVEFAPLKHVKLKIGGEGKDDEYILAMPEMTVGGFIDNLFALMTAIDTWLKLHSDVDIKIALRY